MKIAISAMGDNLDEMMDPRFGRAAYFLIVDSDSLEYQSFVNPNVEARGGAGIQSAQFVQEKGAQAVITGNCGPNAYRVLKAAGIPVFEATVQSVRELLQAYQEERLPIIEQPIKENNRISGIRKSGKVNLPSTGDANSQFLQADQFQEKITQLEERLQEINLRLEELEKRRGKDK
jgi:predicted Fe-Mo cluster-binding NifX family protein